MQSCMVAVYPLPCGRCRQAIGSGLPPPIYSRSQHSGVSLPIIIVFAERVGPLCGQLHVRKHASQVTFRLVLDDDVAFQNAIARSLHALPHLKLLGKAIKEFACPLPRSKRDESGTAEICRCFGQLLDESTLVLRDLGRPVRIVKRVE